MRRRSRWTPRSSRSLRRRADDNNQELELAKIQSARDVQLESERQSAVIAQHERSATRAIAAAAVLVVAVLLGVIYASVVSVHKSDREKQLKMEQVRQQTIQTCIREGNIWINGDCVLSRRS